jgi:hypothetical protein
MLQAAPLAVHRCRFEPNSRALHWSADTDAAIEQRVADILADVQQRATPPCWSTRPLRWPRAPTAWPRWS